MTDDAIKDVKEALKGIETKVSTAMNGLEEYKKEIAPKLHKLDALDEAKLSKITDSVGGVVEEHQKLQGKLKALEEEQKAREKSMEAELTSVKTALNRAPAGSNDPEAKAKELVELRKKAFNDFARSGGERLNFADYLAKRADSQPELKALSVGSDPNGGYLVMPEFGGIIQNRVFESSPIRQLATVTSIGTDALEIVEDNDEATCGWVSESGTRSETNTPTLGKLNFPTEEVYAAPRVTQKMIDDSSIDIEAWLMAKVSDAFARKEATAFVSGTGAGQPRGLLTYAAGTSLTSHQIEQVVSGSATSYTYEGLVDLQNSLKEPYQPNAVFLIRRASNAHLMKIKDGEGRPIFNMAFDKNTGLQPTVMGKPVYFAADVPAVTLNALAMIYGDIREAYQIVDRIGIRILRDPYTATPYVKFYTTKRVGGGVKNYEAVKLAKISN